MMTQEEAMNMSNEQAVQILIPMRNMMCDQSGCPISDVVFALDKAIESLSADVAPVVRCKDCRHAVDYYHEGDCYCSNPKWGLNYFGGSWEFYCADGERKDDE